MTTAPVMIQLDFDTFEAIHVATRELRLGAERARGRGELRYGDELATLADRLARVLADMNQAWRDAHPEPPPPGNTRALRRHR